VELPVVVAKEYVGRGAVIHRQHSAQPIPLKVAEAAVPDAARCLHTGSRGEAERRPSGTRRTLGIARAGPTRRRDPRRDEHRDTLGHGRPRHDGAAPGYDSTAFSNLEGTRQYAVLTNVLAPGDVVGDATAQQAFKDLVEAAACN
jgi:hypothetical protein